MKEFIFGLGLGKWGTFIVMMVILFFLVMGGPGQSAADKAVFFATTMAKVRERRDLVLVDVRGTGESNPLDFELEPEDLMRSIGDTLPAEIYQLGTLPSNVDPLQVGVVVGIAMVLALGATLLPSRHGARLEPAEALRYE